MASASAAERAQSDPRLRNNRGQQVVLTFSQQGTGNFINGCVILIFMVIFGQTRQKLDAIASRNIISLQVRLVWLWLAGGWFVALLLA
jgi:hypothetical protein